MSLRFSSLKYAPAETRTRLRDRLNRFLPPRPQATNFRRTGTIELPDESFLELLRNLTIGFASDENAARESYAGLAERTEEPSFDELINDGFLRVIWGRVSAPFEISRSIQKTQDGTHLALKSLLEGRFEHTYRISDEARKIATLAPIVTAIERGELEPSTIGCQSPEWIAARLWDRRRVDPDDKPVALRHWVDCWRELGSPSLRPSVAWAEEEARFFWDAAMETLESKAGLLGWDELRGAVIQQISRVNGQEVAALSSFVPAVPDTLVDRALWLEGHVLQRAMRDALDGCESVSGVLQLLLNDLKASDHAAAPHPLAAKLIALAAERPELFLILLFRLRVSPRLLADVLLNPISSALGCLIVDQWQQQLAVA